MKCTLLMRELGGRRIWRRVVRCLDRSVSRGMGCFFGCFRIRDEDRTTRPHLVIAFSSDSKPNEALASKNRLASLFLNEEKGDCSYKDVENLSSESPQINKQLRDEAKFLKACGTLPETPFEFRKLAEQLKCSPTVVKDSEPSKFHSWLPNTCIKKIQLDKPIDVPPTPVKLCEEWGRGSVSSELTPSSCISYAPNGGRISLRSSEDDNAGSPKTVVKVHAKLADNLTFSVSPWISSTNVKGRNKSVRFECNFDTSSSKGSSSENDLQNSKKFDSPLDLSVSKPSPKPTPLKLSDEMQTPGTVFPGNVETLANGKSRIRSQYVYSVMNPVENASQWNVLNSCQLLGELRESHEQSENATPESEVGVNKISSDKDLTVEASLSSWINLLTSTRDEDNPDLGTDSSKKFRFHAAPGDRPIIGMVAAHWNENEPPHISPKWWDGNGIPNSTNKYKEDQKVSWHATPFEERLEKALSEESSISQKKHVNGKPIVFDEYDESDTALSQLQAPTHSKSVVSFC